MATGKRERKPKSLKIDRKKKRHSKAKKAKKRLVIKVAKLNRTLKRARSMTKKAVKLAVKGLKINRVPEKLYKRIDAAIAKSAELNVAVQAAVTAAINNVMGDISKAKRTRKTEVAAA